MSAIVIIEAIVILLLLVLMAGLLKSHAEILRKLDGLGAGETTSPSPISARPTSVGFESAPLTSITGTTPSGAARAISLDGGRHPTLLAFLSSGCASCRVFWSELAREPDSSIPGARTVVVTKGADAESPSKVAELAATNLNVVMSSDVWNEFKVPVTPYFMLIDSDATVIGEGSAPTWDQLVSLLRRSADDSDNPRHLNTSERAQFTDSRLTKSGVEPGDTSLYRNPIEP